MRKDWTVLLGAIAVAAVGAGCGSGAPAASARRPLVTIPASAATVKATGITKWRLHDYKSGGTTGLTIVGLDGGARVMSAARIFKVPVGKTNAAAVASLFPTVGRMRFDTKHVVELTMTKGQGALYDLFQQDAKNAKNLAYDCSTGSAVKDGFECGVAVAICTGTTPLDPACWGSAGLCAIDTFNDFSSCFDTPSNGTDPGNGTGSDPGNGTDPGDGTTMAGGDTGGDTGSGDATGGDTGSGDTTGGDTQMAGGDTSDGSGDDGSYDPNGDFGAGTDVGSCSDCGDGFGGDSSGGDSSGGDSGGGDSADA